MRLGGLRQDKRARELFGDDVAADVEGLAMAFVEQFDCSSRTMLSIVSGVGRAAGHHPGDNPLDLCEATLRHVLLEVGMIESGKLTRRGIMPAGRTSPAIRARCDEQPEKLSKRPGRELLPVRHRWDEV